MKPDRLTPEQIKFREQLKDRGFAHARQRRAAGPQRQSLEVR